MPRAERDHRRRRIQRERQAGRAGVAGQIRLARHDGVVAIRRTRPRPHAIAVAAIALPSTVKCTRAFGSPLPVSAPFEVTSSLCKPRSRPLSLGRRDHARLRQDIARRGLLWRFGRRRLLRGGRGALLKRRCSACLFHLLGGDVELGPRPELQHHADKISAVQSPKQYERQQHNRDETYGGDCGLTNESLDPITHRTAPCSPLILHPQASPCH
jgi:hypothetical protein